MMRIHLLCDHKWRDLPNLVALKLALEKLGHNVLLSTTKDAVAMIKAFRPDCVVLNHLFSAMNQKIAASLRKDGVEVVILPTEGTSRPELQPIVEGEFADFSAMDLHLAWNEPTAAGIRTRWGFDDRTVPTLGCTRLDFYSPRFRAAITPREDFCRRYGLDPERPIVTWATSYNFAEVGDSEEARAKYQREGEHNGFAACYRRIGLDLMRIAAIHRQERAAAADAFVALATARPAIQFIVRPHPVENRDFYQALSDSRGLANVRFCPQDYIWNVLNASALHLHRQCTTAIEAWMWDKPTVEMMFDSPSELAWPEREAGSDIAASGDGLIALVDRYVGGNPVAAGVRNYRQDYIRKWFGPTDGARCQAAAHAIDRLLRDRAPRRRTFAPIRNLEASPRQIVAAVARYATGRLPNEPLLKKRPRHVVDPTDKQITRGDIAAYRPLVAGALS